ncbi:unnamed protein product [Mesocestoides corti]|uniref:Serine/threonine-protein phosphatase 2A 55 kDa regulatory subunit B n=1 Tax=Mesocestoides corti TaxID=53468 RepID=A0A3P6H1G2_MESCO|nr:unnamed protein product [Mesocestoides corti]
MLHLVDGFTCVEFDESGEYLAAGDKSGRIYVFNASGQKNPVYNIFCAFTSHEPEFDYLKSLEIEEKINAICWLPPVNNSLHLLSTNDKVIKMWRMSEQTPSAYNFNFRSDDLESESSGESDNLSGASLTGKVTEAGEATCHRNFNNVTGESGDHQTIRHPSSASLRIPRYRKAKNLTIEVRPRKVYANAHTYHINAISVNSDQETFLSADDLRINLWHLDISNRSFTIVDLKPENMEELTEVITCSRFHPELCNMFGYSTSRGVVRLCDMRVRALCDNYVLVLDDPTLSQNRGFFGDIISSLSDFRFDHSGNYILARDYLIWDIRKGDQPCETYSVHEPLRSQLCMLYETDAIFDKFLCSWSDDDRYVFTGSYGNVFRVFDRLEGVDWAYDLGEPGVRPALPSATYSASLAATNAPQQSNIPPSLSLRPYRVRLQPKRFIAPDSELGARFHIQSVCLAHAASIDALASPNNSSTTSVPVPAGSKRRKQILLPSLPITRRQDEEDEGEDVDDSDASDEDGGFRVADLNGKSNSATGLTGLRELDYKRKFLQVAWHPQRRVVATICANEVFICLGKEAGPQMFPQTDEEGDLEGESTAKTEATLLIGSPLDIKAAKRRKRRQRVADQTAPSTMSGFTESATPVTSHLTAVVDAVEDHKPGKDLVAADTSSDASKMEFE